MPDGILECQAGCGEDVPGRQAAPGRPVGRAGVAAGQAFTATIAAFVLPSYPERATSPDLQGALLSTL